MIPTNGTVTAVRLLIDLVKIIGRDRRELSPITAANETMLSHSTARISIYHRTIVGFWRVAPALHRGDEVMMSTRCLVEVVSAAFRSVHSTFKLFTKSLL
jgi:hypothetical protein